MTERASNLLQMALELSEEERAELASSLLQSLDPAMERGVQEAWNEEIARRISRLESGQSKSVPWPELLGRLTSKLPHGK
jgi:putative addiction module component (TIGR02574 family)